MLLPLLGAATSTGCGPAPPGDPYAPPAAATSTAPTFPDVAVHGVTSGIDGGPIAAVQVTYLPADPYLVSIVTTQSDAAGSFTLTGIPGEARDWVIFVAPGTMPVLQAFDTTAEASQTLPSARLMALPEAISIAQNLGAVLDTTKPALSIPVVVTTPEGTLPAAPGDVVVSLQPPPPEPVRFGEGTAVATNLVYETYQVTVSRGGQRCSTARHPALVAADGSITVPVFAGTWSVGPTVVCD